MTSRSLGPTGFTMALTLTLLLALGSQSTWYVDSTAPGPGTGTLADPYARVDYAVAQPSTLSGDIVVIGPGTYPDEAIVVSHKSLVLSAATDAIQTTLVGTGQGSILSLDSVASALVVEGLSFVNGRGTLDGALGETRGGAIYANDSRVFVRDCVFENCGADSGGAIASVSTFSPAFGSLIVEGSTMTSGLIAQIDGGAIYSNVITRVRDSAILGTAVTGRGGAVYVSGAPLQMERSEADGFASQEGGVLYLSGSPCVLIETSVQGAAAGNGGAIHAVDAPVDISDSSIEGACLSLGNGGGLYLENSAFYRLTRTRFVDSSAHSGGAIYADIFGDIIVSECEFSRNYATGSTQTAGLGGAVFCSTDAYFSECVFEDNRADGHPGSTGGAFYGNAEFLRCTLVRNQASAGAHTLFNGLSAGTIASVRQCVITGPLTGGLGHVEGTGANFRSIIEGGASGNNILDADPEFWGSHDYHLLPDSPARRMFLGGPMDAGRFPFDPDWCGQNCDGPLGIPSCTAAANSTLIPASLSALGSLDPAVDRLVLNATDLPMGAASVVVASRTPDFVPMAGGQGSLCLGGTILRFPEVYMAGSQRRVAIRPRLGALPQGNVAQPGDRWFFQVWYRDNLVGQPTSNFTPALLIQY